MVSILVYLIIGITCTLGVNLEPVFAGSWIHAYVNTPSCGRDGLSMDYSVRYQMDASQIFWNGTCDPDCTIKVYNDDAWGFDDLLRETTVQMCGDPYCIGCDGDLPGWNAGEIRSSGQITVYYCNAQEYPIEQYEEFRIILNISNDPENTSSVSSSFPACDNYCSVKVTDIKLERKRDDHLTLNWHSGDNSAIGCNIYILDKNGKRVKVNGALVAPNDGRYKFVWKKKGSSEKTLFQIEEVSTSGAVMLSDLIDLQSLVKETPHE